jgi:hypothetical protein
LRIILPGLYTFFTYLEVQVSTIISGDNKMKMNIFKLLVLLACLLSVHHANAQVPNGGFENWSTDIDGNLNPDSWTTLNSSADTCVLQYTPAFAGNYSMLVKTFDFGLGPYAGIAYTQFPFALRPTHITACVRSTVMPGDYCYLMMALWNGDSSIAAIDSCTFKFDSTMAAQHCLTFPVAYISSLTPDSATIMVIAGNLSGAQLGSQIIVDDIAFSFSSGTNEMTLPLSSFIGNNYPNPASHYTLIPLSLSQNTDIKISIYDAIGNEVKKIDQGLMVAGEHIIKLPFDDLAEGVYIYSLSGNDFKFPGKFIVRN